jgi:hypothetical protein
MSSTAMKSAPRSVASKPEILTALPNWNPKVSTAFALMVEFGTMVIPLETICERFLGLNYRKALEHHRRGTLAFPAARLADSQKGPLMVNLFQLAEYIDAQFASAKREWDKSQI